MGRDNTNQIFRCVYRKLLSLWLTSVYSDKPNTHNMVGIFPVFPTFPPAPLLHSVKLLSEKGQTALILSLC